MYISCLRSTRRKIVDKNLIACTTCATDGMPKNGGFRAERSERARCYTNGTETSTKSRPLMTRAQGRNRNPATLINSGPNLIDETYFITRVVSEAYE